MIVKVLPKRCKPQELQIFWDEIDSQNLRASEVIDLTCGGGRNIFYPCGHSESGHVTKKTWHSECPICSRNTPKVEIASTIAPDLVTIDIGWWGFQFCRI